VSNAQLYEIVNPIYQLYWTTRDIVDHVGLTSPVVAGDFNNDGNLDILAALGSILYVTPGNGDGSFQSAHGSLGPSGSTVTGINVADVNGDGKLDLIITGTKSSNVSFVATMMGNGDWTFQAPIETDFTNVRFPAHPLQGDFNGDGVLDLAFATSSGIQTVLGNGDGTFHVGPSSPLSQIGLNAVALGDFNNDGKLDLVVTVYDPFTTGLEFAGVMMGNGDGSFGSLAALSGTSASFASNITAVVGDFNKDGKLDIATGIETAGSSIQGFIQISLGNGDGTFQMGSSVPNVSSVTSPMLLGDFNGDGNLDLSTGGFEYLGQGDGTFPTSQGSSGLPPIVVAGDFNNDGKLDLLNEPTTTSGSTTYSSVGLFMQTPPRPDFTGIVGPFSSTLVPGSSVSLVTTVKPLDGFTGDVVVSASNLPNGVSVSYNPATVVGGSGSSTITFTAAPSVALGEYPITLSGNSGSITHSTTTTLAVNDTVGDWTGSVDQATMNVPPGATANYSITIVPENGFNGNISLTASNLPPGGTYTFSPATVSCCASGISSASTIFSVKTSSTTPQPDIYNIAATGVNGILSHSTTVYLGVSTSHGDTSGTVTPSTASVPSAGGSASFAITIMPINGGAGDITLSASGLPPGANAMFSPATIPGSSGSSTLTITTPSGTPQGNYQIDITSRGSGVIHQTSVQLTVTP
jgi:hypothetical protein